MNTAGGIATTADRIVVANGVTANVTLDNVKIDLSLKTGISNDNCPFFLTGTAQANITLVGTNELKAGTSRAGLHVPSGAELTIDGAGSLNAVGGGSSSGGDGGAGIGGHRSAINWGEITISGGHITAAGGFNCAGIGGTANGAGTNPITVSGGIVRATGNGNSDISSQNGSGSFVMNGNGILYANNLGGGSIAKNLNKGVVFIGNTGTVYGAVILAHDLTISSSQTLTIPNTASLEVPSGKSLTNGGIVTVESGGTLTNNDGTVTNAGIININNGGTLENNAGTLTNNQTIINQGTAIGVVDGDPIEGAEVDSPGVIPANRTQNSITVQASLKWTTGQMVEYGISTGGVPTEWNTSGIFTACDGSPLTPNTSYQLYARSKAKGDTDPHYKAGVPSQTPVATLLDLEGIVKIEGSEIYGEILAADLKGWDIYLPYSPIYTWTRQSDGFVVKIGSITDTIYNLQATDIDDRIILTISVSNPFYGTIADTTKVIRRRPLQWSNGAVNSKTYDGDSLVQTIATSPGLVCATCTSPTPGAGVINGDKVYPHQGLATELTFSSKNAGLRSIIVDPGHTWYAYGEDIGYYILPTAPPVFKDSIIKKKPITFNGTISASKAYDGNDIFTGAQITISNAGSFQPGDIVVGDEGKVELSAAGASGKFGPAPGTGVLSDVSGFALTGEKAHNYTLSAQPSPVPAEILPLPEARDDRTSVFACHSKTVNVLANDRHVAGGTLTIDRDGKLGSATPSGANLIYNHSAADCETQGGKRDTVHYSICTTTGCDTAKLVVNILRMPRIKLEDSCSRKPYFTITYQYPNAQYRWYRSPSGLDGTWTAMDSSLSLKVYINEDAFYKVEVTYNGDTVEDKVHFVIHRKYRMQGNLWWYISSIVDY